jgi:RNA polymerase-binding transcription factor DksA
MRDDLDRSIAILQGESPGSQEGAGSQDPADAGSALSETERTEAVLHSARGQRDEVLAALARIEQDTYGRCLDCDGEIPAGRLDARPEAARCVSCQAKRSRRR